MNQVLLTIVKNKWFWTVVVVLVILFILWKFQADIKRLFRRDVTDYSTDPPLTDERKAELDQLTQELFAEIDGVNLNPWRRPVLERVSKLNNTELRYLARRYPSYSDGESLKDAIDKEGIPGDIDAKLISRLNAMNL